MDIYRFFHPHHNPRLHRTALRLQELSELEQAASELRKALERAQQRTARRAVPPIMPQHFTDLIKAIRFIEYSLQTICDAHPGDSEQDLTDLINERSGFTGWESWTTLLGEQLLSKVGQASGLNPPLQALNTDTAPRSYEYKQSKYPTTSYAVRPKIAVNGHK